MKTIKQFVVRLSDEDHRALKVLAIENDTSIQTIINTLIKRYLANNGKLEINIEATPDMERSFVALMETIKELSDKVSTLAKKENQIDEKKE